MGKPVYIVETKTLSLFGAVLRQEPFVERRAYKWRRRARLSAWLKDAPGGLTFVGMTTVRIIEQWPRDNVVQFRRAA